MTCMICLILHTHVYIAQSLSQYIFSNNMSRSIPSFIQLIDIERLNWSEFKKELSSKNDKQMLTSYLKTQNYIHNIYLTPTDKYISF